MPFGRSSRAQDSSFNGMVASQASQDLANATRTAVGKPSRDARCDVHVSGWLMEDASILG